MYEGEIILSPKRDGKTWVVLKDLMFYTKYTDWVKVVSPFETDMASIPKFLYSIIGGSASGKYRQAAICHDYLYSIKIVSRYKADLAFLELMLNDEVPRWKAYLMFAAVRMFGSKHYGSG